MSQRGGEPPNPGPCTSVQCANLSAQGLPPLVDSLGFSAPGPGSPEAGKLSRLYVRRPLQVWGRLALWPAFSGERRKVAGFRSVQLCPCCTGMTPLSPERSCPHANTHLNLTGASQGKAGSDGRAPARPRTVHVHHGVCLGDAPEAPFPGTAATPPPSSESQRP